MLKPSQIKTQNRTITFNCLINEQFNFKKIYIILYKVLLNKYKQMNYVLKHILKADT